MMTEISRSLSPNRVATRHAFLRWSATACLCCLAIFFRAIPALADVSGSACVGASDENSQLNLKDQTTRDTLFSSSKVTGIIGSDKGIYLEPSSALDPSKIIIPTTGEVTVSFLTDAMGTGATAALGYLKYQELIDRGYIKTVDGVDSLADTDNNSIPDFHEDLFGIVNYEQCVAHGRTNCGAASGNQYNAPNTVPVEHRNPNNWVATSICGEGETSTFEYEGKTYSIPLIAVKGCENAYQGTIREYGKGPPLNNGSWTNLEASDSEYNNRDYCPDSDEAVEEIVTRTYCSNDTNKECTKDDQCRGRNAQCNVTKTETISVTKSSCQVIGENKDYNSLSSNYKEIRLGKSREKWYSDGGLFARVPNLLEPPDEKNNYRGLGAGMIFHNVSDNGHESWTEYLPEVIDQRLQSREVSSQPKDNDYSPNYPTKLYDSTGRLKAGKSLNNASSTDYSDKVSLGTIHAGTELVFFIIGYSNYLTYDGCLNIKTKTVGKEEYPYCKLAIQTSILPMFSKSFMNAEIEHPDIVYKTERPEFVYDKMFKDWVTQKSSEYSMIKALAKNHDFEESKLRNDTSKLKIPYSSEHRAAHAMTAAPKNYPKHWILSFEDTRRGGDRTYDDVNFVIEKPAGGAVVSTVISQDLCEKDTQCDNYLISTVTLKKEDDPTFSCEQTNTSSCASNKSKCNSDEDGKIEYWVTSNCRTWDKTACKENEEAGSCTGAYVQTDPEKINWIKLDTSDSSQSSYSINLVDNGLYGSQLCWKIQMTSRDAAECNPLVSMLDVSYTAIPTGAYSSASPVALGNVVLYGTYEIVSAKDCESDEINKEKDSLDPKYVDKSMCGYPVSDVAYTKDNHQKMSKDYSLRGHLILKKLYDPYNTSKREESCTGDCVRWNAGKKVMKIALDDLNAARHLYTAAPRTSGKLTMGGQSILELAEISISSNDTELNELIFPVNTTRDRASDPKGTPMCSIKDGVKHMFRLSGDRYDSNYCMWQSDHEKDAVIKAAADEERAALINWLKGIETSGASRWIRGWRLGAISHSVPAIIGPPSSRPLLWGVERTNYLQHFQEAYKNRGTVAYVGTSEGFLHAFAAGNYRYDSPAGLGYVTNYGYFAGDDEDERYGTGEELFFYVPRKMIPYLLNNLTDDKVWTERVAADASPSIADINLPVSETNGSAQSGSELVSTLNSTWQISDNPYEGAKTVLVMSGGPNSTVSFALDISRVANEATAVEKRKPIPMWEIDLNEHTLTTAKTKTPITRKTLTDETVDKRGSRHSPAIVRMSFNKDDPTATRWISVLPTDFEPGAGKAGAVYLIDMATGLPVYRTDNGKIALTENERTNGNIIGFFPLEMNEGIGGDVAGADVNADGVTDTLYVPTTKGRIYKISTQNFQSDRVPEACVLVDLNEKLAKYPNSSKGIYSSISVKVNSSTGIVRIYAGTGNNPDSATDPDDNMAAKNPEWHSWIFGVEDHFPKQNTCSASGFTAQKLAPGHSVWGGAMATEDGSTVYTATAEGAASDICYLGSGEGSGKLYAYGVDSGGIGANGSGNESGHSLSNEPKVIDSDSPIVSAPLIYDSHILVMTTQAELKDLASEGTSWNNPPEGQFQSIMNQIMWERLPKGRLIP